MNELKEGWREAKSRNEDYSVNGETGNVLKTIKKNDPESVLKEVAALKAAEDNYAEKVAEKVWEEVEPKIDELSPKKFQICFGLLQRIR